MADADRYNYATFWSEEDQEWVGLCDAFVAGLSWLDPNRQAAEAGIRAVVEESLDVTTCGAVAAMPLRDAERASLQAALGGLDPRDVAVWRKVRWSDEDLLVEPWVHAMATPERAHAMAQAAYSTAEAAAAIIEERLGETWASKELRSDLASQRRRDLLGSFAAFAGLPGPSPGLRIRLKRLWPFRRPRPRHRTPPSTTSAPRPETPR